MRLRAESGSDGREELGLEQVTGLFASFLVKRSIVMLMINVAANSESHRAARQHVRKKVPASGVTRDADCGGQLVRKITNCRMAWSIVGSNYCRQRPGI